MSSWDWLTHSHIYSLFEIHFYSMFHSLFIHLSVRPLIRLQINFSKFLWKSMLKNGLFKCYGLNCGDFYYSYIVSRSKAFIQSIYVRLCSPSLVLLFPFFVKTLNSCGVRNVVHFIWYDFVSMDAPNKVNCRFLWNDASKEMLLLLLQCKCGLNERMSEWMRRLKC